MRDAGPGKQTPIAIDGFSFSNDETKVELLMNELITYNKPFSVMPYPGRSHAISEGANTTRHFYSLLARYLDEHVQAKRTDAKTE